MGKDNAKLFGSILDFLIEKDLGRRNVINVENAQPRWHSLIVKPTPVIKVGVEAEGREPFLQLPADLLCRVFVQACFVRKAGLV